MCNHQGEEAQRDPDLVEGGVESQAGDDAGQRDGQHDQEADGLPPEEAVPLHGEGAEGAEDQRDEGRQCRGAQAREQGVARALVLGRLAPPVQREALGRPRERPRRVERQDRHDHERRVQEHEAEGGEDPQPDPRAPRQVHQRFSKAPMRRAPSR